MKYEVGLTLKEAKECKAELLEVEKKAELGYKIALVDLALYPLGLLTAIISTDISSFLFGFVFLLPGVALVVGAFKRWLNAGLNILNKGLKFPIFPINLMIAVCSFFIVLSIFWCMPFPFFWKMRKNIQADLEAVEIAIKDLEATE